MRHLGFNEEQIIGILREQEGTLVNHKKLRRLYREGRLQVRRRSARKRALGTGAPLAIPQGPNQRWPIGRTTTTPSGRTAPLATRRLPSTPNSAIP
jgi:hypothetical protein